jgi:small-conductance mechanosensitive channel
MVGAGRIAIAAAALALAFASAAQDAASPVAPPAAPASGPPAKFSVFNRSIAEFRAPLLGSPPADRAANARERVELLLDRGGEGRVAVVDIPQGAAVQVDGQLAFVIVHEDAAAIPGATARSLADAAARTLEQVVVETREARDASFLWRATLFAAIATAIWLALAALAVALWRASARRLAAITERHAGRLKVGGDQLVSRERAVVAVRRATNVLGCATLLLLTWEWLGYVLGLFPYTRPWSEGLTRFLVGTLVKLLESVVRAAPSLLVAALIFALAWLVHRAMRHVFSRIEEGRLTLGAIDRDTAPPTRRLATIAVWLFAAAMAYPYIPGSDTDAFKGLSVLLGVMVSVGASGIVGQAISGLILMYTRAFRPGEYVRVGDREGTVASMGMFTTRLTTGLGEELMVPNSQILAGVTTNYSRSTDRGAFVLDASVSIGYDAPWRQVHALLNAAALRTPGISAEPPPQVFQTALDDFYVQYRLVCRSAETDARKRAELSSRLHAAIQDAFNEHGVQIMSPHYLGDPERAKVVPPARWYEAPASREPR